MTKKELPKTVRPMHGFSSEATVSIPKAALNTFPGPREADKDETIRQLRASLAKLEAENAARKAKALERVKRHRAKP